MIIIHAFISSLFWIGLISIVLKMMKVEFTSSAKKKLLIIWLILFSVFFVINFINFNSEITRLMGKV